MIGLWRAITGAIMAARLMMTTIPMPRRARLSRRNLCRCLVSSIVLPPPLRRWISERRRRIRRLTLPSAMLPEVLGRHRPHPMLQTLGKTCNDRVHVAIPVAGFARLDSLDHETEASVRLAERDDEQDWHVESQSEYRRTAGRLGRPSKEGNERRRQPEYALIGNECDRSAIAQRAR